MVQLDINWARDVAHILARRNIHLGIGTEPNRDAELISILLDTSSNSTWEEVVLRWTSYRGKKSQTKDSLQRQARRARDLLIRSAAGLNPDNLRGAVQFQNRTRANNMLVLGQLLSDSGYHDSSITTIKSAIRIATEFELPDVTLRAVTLLRLKAAMAGDSETVANCDKLIVTA